MRRVKRFRPGICLAAALLPLPLPLPHAPGPVAQATSLPGDAARVATEFLYAFSRNDRDAIEGMLPNELCHLYGPAPFADAPVLSRPRVGKQTGAVDFEGKTTDPALPDKGIMILRYVEEQGVSAWRVRQIYWYEKLPTEARIPEKSPTEADRQQEPSLQEAAQEFMRGWLAGDYRAMDRVVFHWWTVERRPPKWVKMTGASLQAGPTTPSGMRVDFQANLRLIGLMPRSLRGMLWMVEENGAWRVRPLTFAFLF